MGKSISAGSCANNRDNKKRKLGLKPSSPQSPNEKQPKPIKSKRKPAKDDEDPILFGSTKSEPDIPSLEPFTKAQLITFVLDAALSDPELRTRIRSIADSDTSHRNIFVHGLSWDTTKEILMETFSKFGPIEDCNLILDKNTGRAKGYGFVLYRTRSGAAKALKEPQKMIKNRLASCQLASVGNVKQEASARKIYVSNVSVETQAEKLREFFAKFGEIECGPFGFDAATGRSKGYAIFVYKNQEDAKRVLDEPYKTFEGRQLHCKLASTWSMGEGMKMAAPQLQMVVPPAATAVPQPSVLASVAAAQNLALLGQNPAYAALLAQNPLLTAAAFNPGLVNYAALGGVGALGYGGGVGGLGYGGGVGGLGYGGGVGGVGYGGGGGTGLLGSYAVGQETGAAGQGTGVAGLQGYQAASSSQGGQTGSGQAGGAFGGFPSSFVW